MTTEECNHFAECDECWKKWATLIAEALNWTEAQKRAVKVAIRQIDQKAKGRR